MSERIDKLVSMFDGLIKYEPMLKDNPDWSDAKCVEFAKTHHARAVMQRKTNKSGWNNGIPYCRNIWREDKA